MREVAFYRLSRKIINSQEAIPEDARQVMYYSLAIGHHVGVMDGFSELMTVPAEEYRTFMNCLPERHAEARRKLEGVLQWDEIEINRSHVGELLLALEDEQPRMDGTNAPWVEMLVRCLREMLAEPALYLMVKMRE